MFEGSRVKIEEFNLSYQNTRIRKGNPLLFDIDTHHGDLNWALK